MKYFLGFIFSIFLITSACQLDSEVVDRLTDCSEEGIYTYDYQKEWNLLLATYNSSGTETTIDSTVCLDTTCAFVKLIFTDSSYTFDYFLPVDNGSGNFDTLQLSEGGSYDISYCYIRDSTQPVPEKWVGEITFQPDSTGLYTSSFLAVPFGPFTLEKIDLPQGSLILNLKPE